jgi:hypothetical protein
MLKFFKNLIVAQLAKPLIKETKIVNLDFAEDKLSKRFRDKKNFFYIINRKPSPTGFFSNFAFVLNHIKYALKKNYIPIVDMKNFPTIYNEKNKVLNTFNSWEYYFDQISNYSLEKIYKSKRYIFSSQFFLNNMELEIHKLKNDPLIKNIMKKYIKIKKKYIEEVNFKIKKKFKKKMLGVLIRGTTQKIATNHQLPIEPFKLNPIINKILEKEKCDKIFLVTEDLDYFESLKKNFKNKIIFNNSFRSKVNFYNNHAKIFDSYPRKLHRYKLGKEILIDTLMLSKCDVLLYTNSNVSSAAILFSKKKQSKYYISSENNSSNIYLARWKWYIKHFFTNHNYGIKYKLIKVKDV